MQTIRSYCSTSSICLLVLHPKCQAGHTLWHCRTQSLPSPIFPPPFPSLKAIVFLLAKCTSPYQYSADTSQENYKKATNSLFYLISDESHSIVLWITSFLHDCLDLTFTGGFSKHWNFIFLYRKNLRWLSNKNKQVDPAKILTFFHTLSWGECYLVTTCCCHSSSKSKDADTELRQ